MYGSIFVKIFVIIVSWENIYGRNCIKKKIENGHFHPWKYAFFFLEMKSPSFSVV